MKDFLSKTATFKIYGRLRDFVKSERLEISFGLKWHSTFYACADCGQVYWKGSHFEKLQKKVEALTGIKAE